MTSINPTTAILYSELVLSLYPILIKTVHTNTFTQILSRFLVFPALAFAFGSAQDFSAIWGNPFEIFVAILHGMLNLGHIATSYISFKNLPVGSAISLFYLYPIFNIISATLLFGESLTLLSVVIICIAFIGAYLIATSYKDSTDIDGKNKYKTGVVMGILAAITETMIFIFVRSNTFAKVSPYYTVNHLYPAGLAVLLIFAIFNKNIVDTNKTNWVKLIGFNSILGFTGYMSRFYAIPKIPTIIFSLLSFFGVTFGYIWETIFIGDKLSLKGLFGGSLIVISTAILRYFGTV